jgi:TonB family protein
MTMRAHTSIAACAVAVLTLWAPRAQAQASLGAAQELYASAAYDDALAMFEVLLGDESTEADREVIELYRTMCLVAVGRQADADLAIESIVARNPLFRPNADDLSPRMRTAFAEARKRLLPSIIQKKYAEAKTAFEWQNYQAAADGFNQVLEALSDPDMAAVSGQPPLSDLKTLADGFQALTAKALAPPPPPPPPVVPEPVPPVEPPPPVIPVATLRLYTSADANVVPPTAIRQSLPAYPGRVTMARTGVVEVVIDETGVVESATMPEPVSPQYDRLVLSAAKTWQYQPARLDGAPVKFVKRVQVSLKPTP